MSNPLRSLLQWASADSSKPTITLSLSPWNFGPPPQAFMGIVGIYVSAVSPLFSFLINTSFQSLTMVSYSLDSKHSDSHVNPLSTWLSEYSSQSLLMKLLQVIFDSIAPNSPLIELVKSRLNSSLSGSNLIWSIIRH